MNKKFSGLLSASIAAALLTPSVAHATMGMDLIGFGAKSRGMGGIGVAYAQDTLSISNNPANAAKVGNRFDIGMEIFHPEMGVTHDSSLLPINDESEPASIGLGESRYEWFPMPFMGYAEELNDDLSWGVAVVGTGLVTSYRQPENTFYNFEGKAGDKTGVYLIRMLFLPSIAYEVNDDVTVGASLVVAAQGFKARGLEAFEELGFSAPSDTDKISHNQWDTGYGLGFRLGALWNPIDEVTLGLNYSPRVNMSEFDDYSGLFAEQGDFDIAEEYSFGINVNLKNINISLEIQQVNYSDVKSIGNPGPNAADPSDFNPLCPGVDTPDCLLGGDKGMGFGWTDQTRIRLGGDFQYSDKLTLRAGWAYAEAPIEKDQVLFNFLAPATTENNLTFGASYQYSPTMEISVNYLHGFENVISGPTAFTPEGQAPVENANGSIGMVQNAIGAMLGMKF